jgi:hypothetical protein
MKEAGKIDLLKKFALKYTFFSFMSKPIERLNLRRIINQAKSDPHTPIPYESIFNIKAEEDFNAIALQIFKHQCTNNEVYGEFVKHLHIDISSVDHFKKIPFLPISFFKTHEVITKNLKAETVFYSSGTHKNKSQSASRC